jgi:hypothetical protein
VIPSIAATFGTLAVIQEPEKLVRIGMLVLILEIEIQPVLIVQRSVEAHPEIAVAARVCNHEPVVLYDPRVRRIGKVLQ